MAMEVIEGNRRVAFAVAKCGSWERASARDNGGANMNHNDIRAQKGSPTTGLETDQRCTKPFLNGAVEMRNPKFEALNPKFRTVFENPRIAGQYQNPNFKNVLRVIMVLVFAKNF